MYNSSKVMHDHLNALQKEMWDKQAEEYREIDHRAYSDYVLGLGPTKLNDTQYMQRYNQWVSNPTVKPME